MLQLPVIVCILNCILVISTDKSCAQISFEILIHNIVKNLKIKRTFGSELTPVFLLSNVIGEKKYLIDL